MTDATAGAAAGGAPPAADSDRIEHEGAQDPGVGSAEGADAVVPPDVDDVVLDPELAPAPPADPLVEAERARDEYLDHLQRERAEFENFRKRATRERMDALDRGAQQIVVNLLGVLDNFGFALAAARERDADDQLAKGVEMVHADLVNTLQQAGLQEIEAVGQAFDPLLHEAMLQVESSTPVEEPTVVEVLRPGYRFKGKVLRPASVKVAN